MGVVTEPTRRDSTSTALRPFLDAAAPGLVDGPLTGELIAGGKSNLTYAVTDGDRDVGRAPPAARPRAGHRARHGARVPGDLARCGDTAVPVPETFALCADDDVLGAPFYVMELVDGTVYRHGRRARRARRRADPARSPIALIDTLADLHAVDPAAVGLADFGRPEGFLARQVRRWRRQLDASRSRDLPGIDELHDPARGSTSRRTRAAADRARRLPARQRARRPTDDRSRAVLDWEMATLGDPLTDLGAAADLLAARRRSATAAVVADAPRRPASRPRTS